MPEPVRGDQRYLPGLDGLRALAVGAVVAFHVGWGWAQGGLLGVGVFFTLSGYLITDLLLGQHEGTGRLRLADFWLRMLLWDQALIRACASYPNMRVYDWAAAAQDGWFISDGIHYTSAGYAARARLIARALAAAFPDPAQAAGRPANCLVR
jgi:hypothetical protein